MRYAGRNEFDVAIGGNCRSCFAGGQWSPGGDTKHAVDDLAETLLAHYAFVERIYLPQLDDYR